MNLYYFDLNTINESTADFIVSDFSKWLENEYNKRLCKNKGKLFEFSIASNNDEMFYGIDYGEVQLIVTKRDIISQERFKVFLDVADAIDKCKDIALDFVNSHNLVIDKKPSGGLATYYIVSK